MQLLEDKDPCEVGRVLFRHNHIDLVPQRSLSCRTTHEADAVRTDMQSNILAVI